MLIRIPRMLGASVCIPVTSCLKSSILSKIEDILTFNFIKYELNEQYIRIVVPYIKEQHHQKYYMPPVILFLCKK